MAGPDSRTATGFIISKVLHQAANIKEWQSRKGIGLQEVLAPHPHGEQLQRVREFWLTNAQSTHAASHLSLGHCPMFACTADAGGRLYPFPFLQGRFFGVPDKSMHKPDKRWLDEFRFPLTPPVPIPESRSLRRLLVAHPCMPHHIHTSLLFNFISWSSSVIAGGLYICCWDTSVPSAVWWHV